MHPWKLHLLLLFLLFLFLVVDGLVRGRMRVWLIYLCSHNGGSKYNISILIETKHKKEALVALNQGLFDL